MNFILIFIFKKFINLKFLFFKRYKKFVFEKNGKLFSFALKILLKHVSEKNGGLKNESRNKNNLF